MEEEAMLRKGERGSERGDQRPASWNVGFAYLRLIGDDSNELVCLRLDRVYTIGRNPKHCKIVLDSPAISRHHCEILLDRSDCKLRLIDGSFGSAYSGPSRIGSKYKICRVSSNGVFVNGHKLPRGVVAELNTGDLILLCAKKNFGFLVEKIVFTEVNVYVQPDDVSPRAKLLVGKLRSILGSHDPISYLRTLQTDDCKEIGVSSEKYVIKDETDVERNSNPSRKNELDLGCYSDGKTFFLNRLRSIDHSAPEQSTGVTLRQLLHPIDSLTRVFIATFTCDVSWFLDYCKIPCQLPITVACHNGDRCWSASRESRWAMPFSSYPNLLLVYPRFPDEIAFGKDRKKHGVACHHPKLILLHREDTMRVVITSANLVSRQWNHITNTVWWQDFPRRKSAHYSSLFGPTEEDKSDFVAHLAGFVASLINEVPNQAHWVDLLANYDFREATCHLVASVPGVHVPIPSYLQSDYSLSGPDFDRMSELINEGSLLASLCSLLALLKRSFGLWRLQEVLSQHKWPESSETDFIYGSSSVGTSVNIDFLAGFSTAAGKKSCKYSDSQESDPEWGRWRVEHELRNPSMKFLFPTIDRVKSGVCGVHLSRYLLCLSEKTWERLRPAGVFHDAVPYPSDRVGYPMHVKVARRRFHSKADGSSFGWIYCGSHNFSPAAWGQILNSSSLPLGSKLHICNYELGIIFLYPECKSSGGTMINIDDVKLPFETPAPKYKPEDRPATAQAMREALAEARSVSVDPQVDMNEISEDADEDEQIIELSEEGDEGRIYAEMLWSQVFSSYD